MMLRHILTAEDTPSSSLATFAAKPSATSSGASSARALAAEQQRHLDPVRRQRRHHRALDIAATRAVDVGRRALLGAGRRRVEIEKPGPCPIAGAAGLGHGDRLARGHRRDDEIGPRREIGMGIGASSTPISAACARSGAPCSRSSLMS